VRVLPVQLDLSWLPPELAEVRDPDDPRPELARLRDRWGETRGSWPWEFVIRGLDPATWASLRARLLKDGRPPADADRAAQRAADAYLAVARELSGRSDLRTPQEWDRWYRATRPAPIPLARWEERMLAHPELIGFGLGSFNEFFNAPKWSLPPERVAEFSLVVRAAPPHARWRLCLTLLLYCDRAEEAPLLIDVIEQELLDCPRRYAKRNTWPIRILMYRFGVNYFWDVAAWRRWWADYQVRAGQHAGESPRDQSTH
jgi:hypothetical protein